MFVKAFIFFIFKTNGRTDSPEDEGIRKEKDKHNFRQASPSHRQVQTYSPPDSEGESPSSLHFLVLFLLPSHRAKADSLSDYGQREGDDV